MKHSIIKPVLISILVLLFIIFWTIPDAEADTDKDKLTDLIFYCQDANTKTLYVFHPVMGFRFENDIIGSPVCFGALSEDKKHHIVFCALNIQWDKCFIREQKDIK